jgi:glycosyltransferase involved in cell wall biosynthesis
MRIAHIFKDFYPPLPAGITRYIADMADAMQSRGHEVEVHVAGVHRSRRDRMPSGVVVHRHRELFRLLSMPCSPGLLREVPRLDVDVLHAHLPNPIGELGSVRNRRALTVCTFHAQLGRQQILEPFYTPLRTRLFHQAFCIFASSPAMANAKELAAHRKKIRLLPYGVSPRFVSAELPSAHATDTLHALFVGRLVYYKGVDYLLRAIAITRDVVLTIVGDGSDRARLTELTQVLGVTDRVSFLGSVDDATLLGLYKTSDVFILPSVSRAESFGMAMSEAMANGLPAISTALGTGTDWVNIDGVTGLVVAPADVEDLSKAISRLTDSEYRAALARGAYERAHSALSFAHHVDVVEAAYEEGLACRH